MDDANARAQTLGHVEQVRREEDGLAFCAAAPQPILQLAGGTGVQPVGGLIQDQDRRVMNERAGKAQLLLHAHRVVDGVFLRGFRQGKLIEQPSGIACRHPARLPMHFADELQNLPPAQEVVEDGRVGQIADTALHLDPIELTIEPRNRCVPGGRNQDAHEHANGGGLPGAIGPQKAEHRTLLYRKCQAANGDECPVVLAQAFKSDHEHVSKPLLEENTGK